MKANENTLVSMIAKSPKPGTFGEVFSDTHKDLFMQHQLPPSRID